MALYRLGSSFGVVEVKQNWVISMLTLCGDGVVVSFEIFGQIVGDIVVRVALRLWFKCVPYCSPPCLFFCLAVFSLGVYLVH